MPHHQHHRPRSNSSASDDSSSASSGRSPSSRRSWSSDGGHSRRRRGHHGEDDKGGSNDSESDSSSASSLSTSSSTSSRHSHHSRQSHHSHKSARRRRLEKEKKQRELLLFGGGGVMLLLFVVVVVGYYALYGNKTAVGGGTGAVAGTAGTAGGGGAGTTKASTGGGSSKPPSSSSKSSAASSPSASSPSPSPTSDGGGGGGSGNSSPPADQENKGPHKLISSFQGETFFDGWEFFTSPDPTHGQVNYVSKEAAQAANLISTTSSSAVLRVDNSSTLSAGANRDSVRITSSQPVGIGTITIADIKRMPWGCATWPAWWMVGTDWPNKGEIDILEGVHDESMNHYTLHVKDSNCKQGEVDITGTAVPANNDCNALVNDNTGCSYSETAKASYGETFNAAGGGVFVTQFAEDAISIWFWSRPDVPEDITSGSPDNSKWGKPSAMWKKDTCPISEYFGDQTLVINTTLCGDWAGATFPQICASAGGTCSDYVADPAHFNEAWWEIGFVKVYSIQGG